MTRLTVATVLAAASVSIGMSSAIPPSDNAALHYLRAHPTFDRTGVGELFDAMQDDDSVLEPGSEGSRQMLERQQAVDIVLKGAFMDECDFEIDYSHGFDTLLPHLGQVRALSRLLAVDARRLEFAEDLNGSATRTAALYRMAGHVGRDGVLINSLVGMAIANVANEQAGRLASKDLSDADRKIILNAIDSLSAHDPFEVLDAIALEKEIVLTWLPQKFSGEDAAADFYASMSSTFGDAQVDEQMARFEAMDEQGFIDAVELAATAYDEMIEAMYEPDMAEQLTGIEQRVESGEFGPVAQVAVPAFGRAAESAVRAKGDLASSREQVAPKDD